MTTPGEPPSRMVSESDRAPGRVLPPRPGGDRYCPRCGDQVVSGNHICKSGRTPSPDEDVVEVRRADLVCLLTEYHQPPEVLARLWAAASAPASTPSSEPSQKAHLRPGRNTVTT